MRDKKGRVQSSAGAQPAARSRPRGRRSAIDRAILLRMVRLRAEFVEQRLRVFQICRVEAFGEPGVDVSEHHARLVTAVGVTQQSRKAHRRAQFPPFGLLNTRELNRGTEAALSFLNR